MNGIKKFCTTCNAAELGIIALLCAYPLYLNDYYFNVTVSKMGFFAVSSSAALFLCLVIWVVRADFGAIRLNDTIKKITACDWLVMVFLAACFMSWILSDFRTKAFFGTGGRHMGFLLMLMLVCAYIFISRFYVVKQRDFWLFAAAFSVVAFLGLLEFLGFDPFGLIEATPEKYRNNFLSTLGNLNVFSSYMCVGTPFAMYCYCFEKKTVKSILWLIVSCIGFLGLFICNSDGGYLGIGAAFIVCGFMAFKGSDSLKRVLSLAVVFFGCGKAIWLLCESSLFDNRSFSSMTKMVIAKPYTYLIIAVLAVLAVAVSLFGKHLGTKLLKAFRIIFTLGIVLAFFGVLAAVVYFSKFDLDTDLGGFEYLLRFNDDWGTFRGYVWRWTVTAFGDYPFINKLFGMGEDTLALVLRPIFADEMAATGLYFDNAHNEFLQYLATIGIVGVGSYIGMIVLCVVKLLKGTSMLKSAMAVVIIAYAAQSCINILQPLTSPYIFVFISLMQSAEIGDIPAQVQEKISKAPIR